MPTSRHCLVPAALVATALVLAPPVHSAQPTPEEMALRDRWVREHFPARLPAAAPEPAPEPGLVVWTNYGPVVANALPDKPLKIADRTFSHGLYGHAPSRVQVVLPAAGRALDATAGILTNPASRGGSVVCSVLLGDQPAFRSPVLHRDQPGVPVRVDLAGRRDFTLAASPTPDGISSDQVVWGDATVTLADGKQVRLGDLPLRDPLTLPRHSSTPPFSFHYDGRPSDVLLPAWPARDEPDAPGPGRTTRARTWTDPRTGLAVRATAVVYSDFPTVEWTLTFKNTSDRDTPLLAGILPLDTRLECGAAGEFRLHHFVGSPCCPNDYEPLETPLGPGAGKRITTEGGRPTNSDLPYFNLATGPDGGAIAVLGWAGQWAAHFARDAATGLRLTGGQECTSFRLRPGEEVRAPVALLQFYRGDWVRAQNVWRSWMLRHNAPRRDGKLLPPFVYVCTGNRYPGLMTDAATELTFLRRYFEEGLRPDYWIQDAGWYPCGPHGWPRVGTWEVDRTRWPKGLREATDWLHARGAGAVTWFEPERVAPGTWLADHHPEWVHGGAAGGLLKLHEPACRQWLTDRISQVITQEGIDFYRQDFNIDPLISWRGHDADDRQGITEIRHVEGYFSLWDDLVRRHPKLWIDTCASGGRRNDLETLRRAVPILRSDWVPDPGNPQSDPLDQQNHVHGISFWMPYHGSGFEVLDEYLARSLLGPIVGVGVDSRRQDLDYDLLRKIVRDTRQAQPYFLGDYHPLTPYSRSRAAWAARQWHRPDTGDGLVQAFRRRDAADDRARFRLNDLAPNARYTVTDLDSPRDPRDYTGRQLMDDGLPVALRARPAAALITYRRQP